MNRYGTIVLMLSSLLFFGGVSWAQNSPPVITPISPQTVNEGSVLDVLVTATDPDAGDVITLSAELLPTNAIFQDSTGGIGGLRFSPDYSQAGPYQVRIIAQDVALAADTELVDITVTNTDRAPVLAAIGPQSVAEGGHLDVRVSATDPDGDVITLSADQLPANSIFDDSTGGIGGLVFNPDFSQAGSYQVRVIATSNLIADTGFIDINVTNIDRNPVLTPIAAQNIGEGSHLALLVTASDPDGDAVALSADNLPLNAAFHDSLNGRGSLIFDPDYSQNGFYQIRIFAVSNSLADTELVDITVTNTDRAPVLTAIGPQSVAEGGHLDVRVSATDPDGDIIALRAEQLPANSFFDDSTGGIGGLVFNPDFTQAGLYHVRIIATSNSMADTELCDITVTDIDHAPVLNPIGAQTIAEGAHLAVRITASDSDNDPITLLAENLPLNAAFGDSTGGVGGFIFDPDFTQAGAYQARFIARSNSLADTELVSITVTDVNQPPVITPIPIQHVTEGGHLAVRTTATDVDGDPITLAAEQIPANAVFGDSSGGIGGLVFDPDYSQAGSYQVRIIATSTTMADTELVDIIVAELDRAPVLAPIGPQTVNEADSLIFIASASDIDGTTPSLSAVNAPFNSSFTDNGNGTGRFRFLPDYNQSGVFNVIIIASDGTLADSEIVQITVNDVNRPPILGTIGPQSVAEGALLQLVVISYDLDGSIPLLSTGVLPANATFQDSLNGDGLFRFQPDFSQSGVYNVLFVASDGFLADSELVQITVTSTDLPPVFDPLGAQFVLEGHSLVFDIHAVDPDGITPELTVTNMLNNAFFADHGDGTGTFQYNPDFTQSGVDTVIFFATADGLSDTLPVQITTVDAGNQPPSLLPIGSRTVNEGQQLQFNVYGTDPDGVPPSLLAQFLPPNAVFHDSSNGVATLTFNPNYDQAGIDTVLFIATDGQLADSEWIYITVNNVNQAPILNFIGQQSVMEGDSLGININASDPDGNFLRITAAPIITNMTFNDHGDGTAYFGFLPNYTQSGTHYVRFIVSDSVLADSETVRIDVIEAGNQNPVLAPIDTAYYVTEGMSVTVPVSATDVDNNSLILSAAPLVTNMTFTDNGNGTGQLVFNPSYVQSGNYGVTIRVYDGQAYDSAFTRIYVAESGNQNPILNPIGPRTVAEGGTLIINMSAVDPEGYMPFFYAIHPPDSSTFVDHHNGTATFTYWPDYYSPSADTVRFMAMDIGGLTDIEDVIITIIDVNRPPTIAYVGDTLVYEGGTLVATVTAYDSTANPPQPLDLTTGYLPPNSNFVLYGSASGRFTFRPNYNQAGRDSANFIAIDSDAPTSTYQIWVYFRILNTNRRPDMPQPPPAEINQGDILNMTVTASDPDGDPVTMFINSYPPNPPLPLNAEFHDMGGGVGNFTFSPDFTQSGLYMINFAASDGSLITTRPTLIQVNDMGNQRPILDAIGPVNMNEGDSVQINVTSRDADGTYPTLSLRGALRNMYLTDLGNGTGIFRFRALFNQSGVHEVYFIASDEQTADSQLVIFTIAESGNQPPDLAPLSDRNVQEGGTVAFPVFAVDPDSSIPHLQVHNLPANAVFTDSLNGHGRFSFSPSFFQSGVHSITFLAVDSEDPALADSQTIRITVTDYNRRPTIVPMGPFVVNEGVTLNFTVVSTDPDSTIPRLAVGHMPPNATFADNHDGTGSFSFTPSYFQAGVDSAKFYATDANDQNLYATMTVNITIVNVNQLPVLRPIPDTSIADGFLLVLSILATDADSTLPTLFQRSKPDSAAFVDNGNGTGEFRWRPRIADIGPHSFYVGCRDRRYPADADSQLVTITVISAGNHPPVFTLVPDQTVRDDDTLRVHIVSTDIDGDPIQLSVVGTLPTGMLFADSANGRGSIFWVPQRSQGGSYPIALAARDPLGLTDSLRFTVHVITFIRGDANGNGIVNGIDVIYLVNYFKGGPAPIPLDAGDVNADGHVNGIDVVYFINYLKGGPPPPPMPPSSPGQPDGPREILLRTKSVNSSTGM